MSVKKQVRIEASESATDGIPAVEDLCFRLRAIRKGHRLSLAEVAMRIGCSVGFLSQIERGISSPSLRNMISLAEVYGVELSVLFSGGESAEADVERIVVRRAERGRLDLHTTGITKESLTERDHDGVLHLYEMVIAPGGRSGEVIAHAGEECGVVVEGRMVLEVDGVVSTLDAGDSFRFASRRPHRYWNPTSDHIVRILWTTTSVTR